MTTTLIIDGHAYTVPVKAMSCSSDPLEGSAERTRDGLLHVERIGVFDNYTLEFGTPTTLTEVAELAALCVVLTSATVFHSVSIPGENGNAPWNAYFAGVKKDAKRRIDSTTFWKNLACSVIAQGPTRT